MRLEGECDTEQLCLFRIGIGGLHGECKRSHLPQLFQEFLNTLGIRDRMIGVFDFRDVLEIGGGGRLDGVSPHRHRNRLLWGGETLSSLRRLVTAPGFEAVAEEALADRVELEFHEQRFQFVVVPWLDLEFIQFDRAWSLAVDGHQALGQQCIFAMCFQSLL